MLSTTRSVRERIAVRKSASTHLGVLRLVSLLALAARVSGALLVLAAGAMHLWLYFDYFHRVHVIGALFLLNAAAAMVIGVTILLSSHPLATAGGIAYAAATLLGFFLSVYNGLFGYVERLTGAWQEAAGGVEVAAIAILLPLLVASMRSRMKVRGLQAGT
jgi:hypothetical protein